MVITIWTCRSDRWVVVMSVRLIVIIGLACVAESMRGRSHRPNNHNHRSNIGHRLVQRNNGSDYSRNIIFKYYDGHGEEMHETNARNILTYQQAGCDGHGNFAIIVHGWKENCDAEWVSLLATKLMDVRGGCVMCMDYSPYATDPFLRLVRHFDPIVQILTTILMQFESQGFRMSNGYMFGFSFGGQLVTEAGRRIGFKRLALIDTCDMAGPGFDYRPQPDHRLAAQNVQCLHTSRDKGTRHYNCHQDWRLGNCGYSQDAAAEPPFGSHGLCPYFYISAFDHDFYAVVRPDECPSRAPVQLWPDKFKMGYMEMRKSQVQGELFALTSITSPYNVNLDGHTERNDLVELVNQVEQNATESETFQDVLLKFLYPAHSTGAVADNKRHLLCSKLMAIKVQERSDVKLLGIAAAMEIASIRLCEVVTKWSYQKWRTIRCKKKMKKKKKIMKNNSASKKMRCSG